jgi:hypothetical protein
MLAPPSPDRTVMAWIPAQGRDDGGGSRRAKALGLSRFSPLSQKLSPSPKPHLHSSPSPLIRGAPPEAFVGGAGSGACGGSYRRAPATEQSGAGWVRTPTPREAFATFVRRHYDRLWLWPTLRATGHSRRGSGLDGRVRTERRPIRQPSTRSPESKGEAPKTAAAGARASALQTNWTGVHRAPATPRVREGSEGKDVS